MSYTKITSFAVKDTMADNNPLKVVRGKEFDDEFDAITTAMTTQDSTIAGLVTTPTGALLMYASAVAPAGFLLCDGSARSRATYTALFQAIGTAYGAGDGTNTFNVPNLSGRFPYGGVLGQLGGSADSTVPAHAHTATVTITDPTHSHAPSTGQTFVTTSFSGDGAIDSSTVTGPGERNPSTANTAASATGITATSTIASAGVSVTNTNLPPFIGLNFIIKT